MLRPEEVKIAQDIVNASRDNLTLNYTATLCADFEVVGQIDLIIMYPLSVKYSMELCCKM
ncbi:hypothetical protein T11_6016 [Trichinella zimbabwensis]|uniref:Uncharacterized protein n=1 Tax=Trichinella zimbabwensis TaxID=268475 RepID=A0A0V1HI92_9BILA|nr:hypothetical protein T11_6016 [Trichinella zimbabwensis]